MRTTMSVIIEFPGSLFSSFQEKNHGANKVSQTLFKCLANKLSGPIFVVTNAPYKDFLSFKTQFKEANLIHTNYTTLHKTLENYPKPDLAFTSDLAMEKLLFFRNYFGYTFPVIGLVHYLGSQSSIATLKQTLSLFSPIDILICPSAHVQKTVLNLSNKLSPKKILKTQCPVIPFGIDTSTFIPELDKKTLLKKQLNLTEKDILILHISRINAFTKTDLLPLIHNFETTTMATPSVHLFIVGELHSEFYFEHIKLYIEERGLSKKIHFITRPDSLNMHIYFQAADIFISLADNPCETFGLTAIEAMSCCLPVILSDFCAYSSFIENQKEGFLIPTFRGECHLEIPFFLANASDFGDTLIQSTAIDNSTFRKALSKLIKNPNLRSKMGILGRKVVLKKYTLEKMTISYLALFNKTVLNSKKNSPNHFLRPKLTQLDGSLNHVASLSLTTNTCFKITPFGKSIIEKKESFFTFEKHLIERPFLALLMDIFKKGIYSLENLTSFFPKEDSLQLTLLYLLKHDLLEIVKSESFSKTPHPR